MYEAAMTGPIPLDIVSDTICPWCYIGKRRLEKALAMRPKIAVDIRWRPFQLDPTIPKEGIGRQAYLERKFGGPEGARTVYARIDAAGAEEGIQFAFGRITRTPNTIDSHRLIRWAASAGCQDELVERLFAAYFSEGADIGERDVLTHTAGEAGMDADLVGELLSGGADLELVEKEIALAHEIGVTGVPCFVFAHRFGVMGAQSPEILAESLDRAQAEGVGGSGTTG